MTTVSAPRPIAHRPRSARRTSPPSRNRRWSTAVLIAGTVLAVAAAFGSDWMIRGGVAIAVLAALIGCTFAWREIRSTRRAHARQLLRVSQDHGAVLTEERSRNAAVVDTLTGRVRAAGVTIEGQRITIAELRTDISALHGDRAFLTTEVTQRERVIASLRDTVRAREAELIVLRDDGAGEVSEDCAAAEVQHRPRRVLAEHESVWADVPAANELWSDGSHPTVVDLKMIDLALVRPNYETDREVG